MLPTNLEPMNDDHASESTDSDVVSDIELEVNPENAVLPRSSRMRRLPVRYRDD